MAKFNPLVSVLVPTRNSARYLKQCLESIKNQSYKNIEIIVIDNFSDDGTIDIAKKYTKKILKKGPERSAQLNYGAQKAYGKYLYRVDSDFFVDHTHIENCVNMCETEKLDGILTFNRSHPSSSFWAKVRNFERKMYQNDKTILASRFFTKNIFKKVGGFNENLVAFEDYDLQARMYQAGGKFGQVKTAETHLGEPITLGQIAKEAFYFGKTSGKTIISSYFTHHPQRALAQIQPFRPAYLRNLRSLLAHPLLTLGLIWYKLTVYLFSFEGFLVSFFKH